LAGESITQTTTALLFVVGAAFGLVQSIPILSNANAAADRLAKLDVDLHAAVSQARDGIPERRTLDRIEMRSIEFSYKDRFSETAFKIGPIDFNLRAGELVFVTGGNGSGKSTFMRVLAGLYPPSSGEVTLLYQDAPLANRLRLPEFAGTIRDEILKGHPQGGRAADYGTGLGQAAPEGPSDVTKLRPAAAPFACVADVKRSSAPLASANRNRIMSAWSRSGAYQVSCAICCRR